MHVKIFRYFVEVAETGSFNAAAKKFNMTQQGLNKVITSLEEDLGTTLLERSRTGTQLTDAGKVFLKHAKRLVADYDDMVNELYAPRFQNSAQDDLLSIYVTYYPAQICAGSMGVFRMLRNATYVEEPFDKVVERALNSDGSYLCLVDVHSDLQKFLAMRPDLTFDPIIETVYGVVWKDGSPLAGKKVLDNSDVYRMPIAVNTFREMARLTDWIFADTPLENIRLGATNPHMLLEYAQGSPGVLATYDSFGFFLSQLDPYMPTDGLNFTPLSTPKARCKIGFLSNKRAKPQAHVRNATIVLRKFIEEHYGEYLRSYPL